MINIYHTDCIPVIPNRIQDWKRCPALNHLTIPIATLPLLGVSTARKVPVTSTKTYGQGAVGVQCPKLQLSNWTEQKDQKLPPLHQGNLFCIKVTCSDQKFGTKGSTSKTTVACFPSSQCWDTFCARPEIAALLWHALTVWFEENSGWYQIWSIQSSEPPRWQFRSLRTSNCRMFRRPRAAFEAVNVGPILVLLGWLRWKSPRNSAALITNYRVFLQIFPSTFSGIVWQRTEG